MNYWNRTNEIKAKYGGQGPPCPYCTKPMFPEDDHGRFRCMCKGYMSMERARMERRRIPQVTDHMPDGEKDLPDEVKKEIPPINRLELPPTEKEKKKLAEILKGQRELMKEIVED